MKYNLYIYKLNLTTNKYEQENTITCDDDNNAKDELLYLYKDRDLESASRKYTFSYTSTGINITCQFLQVNKKEGDCRYFYKYHYEFTY